MTKKKSTTQVLRLPALEIRQGTDRLLYQFAVDGKRIDEFATVSRIRRGDSEESGAARVEGYQRPEALSHVASIRRYIESVNPLIPNSLVIAFDDRVFFESTEKVDGYSRHGWLNIPVDPTVRPEDRPGWIVDGQQRSAAIRDARVDSFPMAITAFITSNEDEQREQFILVNSVKPLPKSLIFELLPSTEGLLPNALARKKLASVLLERLNYTPDSPFFQRIRTPTNPDGFIKDNSVLRMLDNSISDGVLYLSRDSATGMGDTDQMIEVVNRFWRAVALTFTADWESTPRKSRLVHGVGIVSLGYLMDATAERLGSSTSIPSTDDFCRELSTISAQCCWSSGSWELAPGVLRPWNEFQNTPRDIQMLTNHLLSLYRRK